MGARFSAPVQTGPGAHPPFCTMGTGSFPGVKSGRGVKLTSHPLLVSWSWKSRAIRLHFLWAVRPVQSLKCLYKGAVYLYLFFFFRQSWGPLFWSVDCSLRTNKMAVVKSRCYFMFFLFVELGQEYLNWNSKLGILLPLLLLASKGKMLNLCFSVCRSVCKILGPLMKSDTK
jgi:hypothetical protein